MAGSWSTKLHTILRPAWDSPYALDDIRNPKRYRHPPGAIWKRVLGKSVFFDLAGDSFERRRRFVRLETLGLSGIVFYEISSGHDRDGSHAQEDKRPITRLTRTSVFGDPGDPSDIGMGIDRLIDAIGAQLVYFPAYACTSFSSGQAMNAFIRDQPNLQPLPASEGFSVDSAPPSIETMRGPNELPYLLAIDGITHARSTSLLRQLYPRGHRASVSLDSDFIGSDSEDENDVSISTVNSVGPCTPPRIFSASQTVQAVSCSTFALEFGEGLELGYVLGDAMAFFDRPVSSDSDFAVTQDLKTRYSKTRGVLGKENIPLKDV